MGMGRALAESSTAAAEIFASADEALGDRISRLAFEGPADRLDQTENAQPAMLATSIAFLAALDEIPADNALSEPAFMAGHSMGQYSAMVAAGVLDLFDAIRLVRVRGRLMQASAEDGAMAAIIGLDDSRIPELEATGKGVGTLTIANRNAPGQVVISGERAAVQAAADIARDLGAKRAIVLPVSVAAHSPLMEPAADGMRAALAKIAFGDPTTPLLANADARLLESGEACRAELVEHLTRGVDWVRAVETMRQAGVDTFIEVGPGKVLTNLIKRIAPDVTAIAIDDPASPGGLRTLSLNRPFSPNRSN